MPARVPRVTRTEAVVIRHRRFGEADRIVTLLTPARGKLDAIAKGALRPRSKLAGHLEPMTHAEVLLAHGPQPGHRHAGADDRGLLRPPRRTSTGSASRSTCSSSPTA